MRSPVFIGSEFVAQYPTGGGNFFLLQYLLSLRSLGIDVYWLRQISAPAWRQTTPRRPAGRG